jgi:hypothetical protein
MEMFPNQTPSSVYTLLSVSFLRRHAGVHVFGITKELHRKRKLFQKKTDANRIGAGKSFTCKRKKSSVPWCDSYLYMKN